MENNFRYSVSWEDNGHHNCSDHGCRDEGICRCYRITSVDINYVDIGKITDEFFDQVFDITSKTWKRDDLIFDVLHGTHGESINFWHYCINRILTINKIYQPSFWEASWEHGYYGDEVESISIKKDIYKKIKESISEIQKLSNLSDIVKFLLKEEYGHILDKLVNKENYKIEIVDIDSIYFPQNKHYETVIKEDLSYINYNNRYSKIELQQTIQGICIKENNKYTVVDGYHRIANYKLKNVSDKIKIISIC